jgi:TolB protein
VIRLATRHATANRSTLSPADMFRILSTVTALALAVALRAATAPQVNVIGESSRVIPISIAGISGDALRVLEFDLFVAGFEIVPTAQAQYELSGKADGQVEGQLSLVEGTNRNTLFNRAYPGGTPRAQAHALADDVVTAVTGRKGIGRSKIVFKVHRERTSEVYASDFDGANPVQLTTDNNIVAAPAWRPGTRSIYYMSYRAGNADIYLQDLNTGSRSAIVRFSGSNISPAASVDGSRLAMILSKSGSPDLWVSDANGGNPVRLTSTTADESSPCWSPDGSKICVVSRESGYPLLYTIPSSGGTMKRLTTGNVRNTTEPDWSPDGKWIAFTRQRGDGFDICVVPAEGGDAKVITEGEDPCWAPNSRTIVFARRSGKYGPQRLSLLDWPTGHVKDAARVEGSSSQPNWSR